MIIFDIDRLFKFFDKMITKDYYDFQDDSILEFYSENNKIIVFLNIYKYEKKVKLNIENEFREIIMSILLLDVIEIIDEEYALKICTKKTKLIIYTNTYEIYYEN